MKKHKQKGYVLVITIVIIFVISTIMLTGMTVVYKYSASLENSKIELRDEVK